MLHLHKRFNNVINNKSTRVGAFVVYNDNRIMINEETAIHGTSPVASLHHPP